MPLFQLNPNKKHQDQLEIKTNQCSKKLDIHCFSVSTEKRISCRGHSPRQLYYEVKNWNNNYSSSSSSCLLIWDPRPVSRSSFDSCSKFRLLKTFHCRSFLGKGQPYSLGSLIGTRPSKYRKMYHHQILLRWFSSFSLDLSKSCLVMVWYIHHRRVVIQ